MLVRRTIGVGLALMLSAATTAARAQDGGSGARWGASVGAYIPTQADISDAFGSPWWSAGLTYDLIASPKDAHRLGVGWVQAPGGDSLTVGQFTWEWEFRMIPVTYTYLRAPGGFSRGLYIGGGGGAYLNRSELKTTVLGVTTTEDDTQTRFGLHAVAGYAFTSRLAAELRFTKVFDDNEDDGATADPDGITLALTGRF